MGVGTLLVRSHFNTSPLRGWPCPHSPSSSLPSSISSLSSSSISSSSSSSSSSSLFPRSINVKLLSRRAHSCGKGLPTHGLVRVRARFRVFAVVLSPLSEPLPEESSGVGIGTETGAGTGIEKLPAASERFVAISGFEPPLPPAASLKEWNLSDKHLLALTAIAFAMGGAVVSLFVAAIPTLLAFKRAAESMEKLFDTAREELPGTMAAVRLSGMEISDLTMELNDIGQEITDGVRNSGRAIRAAEDGFRRMSNMTSMAFSQEQAGIPEKAIKPSVGFTARQVRERLVQARSIMHGLISLKQLIASIRTHISKRRIVNNHFTSRSIRNTSSGQ